MESLLGLRTKVKKTVRRNPLSCVNEISDDFQYMTSESMLTENLYS